MVSRAFTMVVSAGAVGISVVSGQVFWVLLLPFAFSRLVRHPRTALLTIGVTVDIFSSHPFGIATLACVTASFLAERSKSIFHASPPSLAFVAFAGSVAVLAVFAFFRITEWTFSVPSVSAFAIALFPALCAAAAGSVAVLLLSLVFVRRPGGLL